MSPRIHVLEPGWSRAGVARSLAARTEEPFFVFDAGEVAARVRRWRALLPRVEPFYAVKCNDSPLLLRTLAALGAGFDCASRAEIEAVINLPVAPERIIYANPAKMESHMRYAVAARVTLTTFDCEEELHKIKTFMPHSQLLLRIRCDAAEAQCPLGIKYGCDPIHEAPRLLEVAAALSLDVAGVAFHVGSGASEPAAYARGVLLGGALCARAAALGLRTRILDIGGGFQGRSDYDLQEVSDVINAALETHFPDGSVRVIAEPGRYLAAAAFTLVTCVFAKRELRRSKASKDSSEPQTMYFMNDGVYGSFKDNILYHCRREPLLLEPSSDPPRPCSLWGPTLDGLDCVLPSTLLPPLAPGAWLLFHQMGAYTIPGAGVFNGFPLPKPHAFMDRELWIQLKDSSPFSEDHFDLSGLRVPPKSNLHTKTLELTDKMQTNYYTWKN